MHGELAVLYLDEASLETCKGNVEKALQVVETKVAHEAELSLGQPSNSVDFMGYVQMEILLNEILGMLCFFLFSFFFFSVLE